jgi:hypothetical protein
MENNKPFDKNRLLFDAKKMAHHVDLLISQCNIWLPPPQYGKKKKSKNRKNSSEP